MLTTVYGRMQRHGWSSTSPKEPMLHPFISLHWLPVVAQVQDIDACIKNNHRLSQGRHAHSKCPLRFVSQVDFESSFQQTKNSRIIFVIFDTITLYVHDYNVQLLNSNLRLQAGAEPHTDTFIQLYAL